MFGRKINQLDPPQISSESTAQEVLRVWTDNEDTPHVTLRPTWPNSEAWGILLVDIARHVARSYTDIDASREEDVMSAIKQAFDSEWQKPRDSVVQLSFARRQVPPHLSKTPSRKFEILTPEKWTHSEPPGFGGTLVTLLSLAMSDENTIEFDIHRPAVKCSDSRALNYLESIVKDGQLPRLIEHCRAMMHPGRVADSIGWLCATQGEWAYILDVFERVDTPYISWKIVRTVRVTPTD